MDALATAPNLWPNPSLQVRQRETHPPYPDHGVTVATLEKEQKNFEITRKAFFTMSGYMRYADWALGSAAYLSLAYLSVYAAVATFNSRFPNVAMPIKPLKWSLRVGPPALATIVAFQS